jgi:hypothetical protein
LGGTRNMAATITIEDPLAAADSGAIEVTVELAASGSKRWCFFMTPRALEACGDTLAGSSVRVHLGEPHMIVVSRIDQDVITEVLRDLEKRDELVAHTAPLDSTRRTDEEAFLGAVRALRRSRIEEPHAWASDTIEDYLEAAIAWAEYSNFGENQNVRISPWAKVQAFLEAGRVYE